MDFPKLHIAVYPDEVSVMVVSYPVTSTISETVNAEIDSLYAGGMTQSSDPANLGNAIDPVYAVIPAGSKLPTNTGGIWTAGQDWFLSYYGMQGLALPTSRSPIPNQGFRGMTTLHYTPTPTTIALPEYLPYAHSESCPPLNDNYRWAIDNMELIIYTQTIHLNEGGRMTLASFAQFLPLFLPINGITSNVGAFELMDRQTGSLLADGDVVGIDALNKLISAAHAHLDSLDLGNHVVVNTLSTSSHDYTTATLYGYPNWLSRSGKLRPRLCGGIIPSLVALLLLSIFTLSTVESASATRRRLRRK